MLTKNGQLFALILGVVSIVIALFSLTSGIKSAGYSTSDDLNAIMKNNENFSLDFLNAGLGVIMLLVGLALAAWLIFSLLGLFSNPKGSMKFIIGLAVILGLFFILYSMAEHETTGRVSMLLQRENISEGVSKMIGAGVQSATYIAIAAIATMILFEIRNLFK